MAQEAQERQRDPELRIAPHSNLRSGRSLLLPSLTTCCDRQLIGVPRWIEWDWRLKPFTPSSRFQNALTAEAGMWWHSVSLSASRGWIQAGRSLLVNFFSSLLATFAFWVVQPTGFTQRLIQIVVNGLKTHGQTTVHSALQPLDLEVGEIRMILAGNRAVGDEWSTGWVNEAQALNAFGVISEPTEAVVILNWT